MSQPEQPITMRQIVDIKTSGKWIELWFADGKREPFNCDQSCKSYMLFELLARFDLTEHILKHGLIGLWIEWPKGADRPIAARKHLAA